jgi:hypothetical protein
MVVTTQRVRAKIKPLLSSLQSKTRTHQPLLRPKRRRRLQKKRPRRKITLKKLQLPSSMKTRKRRTILFTSKWRKR